MESETHWPDPYEVPLDTPERRAWAAAEALKQYIQNGLGFSVFHPITDNKQGEMLPEFAAFPGDAVIVRIGSQTSMIDLEMHALLKRSRSQ
jgi:hypothetical protein